MILSPRTLISIGTTAFLFFVIALMPASLALSLTGADKILHYSDAHGTIWNARLTGAQVQGRPLGSLDLSISPLSVLTGTLAADVDFAAPGRRGSFALTRGDTTAVEDLQLSLDITARIGQSALTGALTLQQGALVFDGNRCTAASGSFRTNILAGGFVGTGIDAPVLTGSLACENSKIAFTFGGENDFVTISGGGALTGASRPMADVLLAFKAGLPISDDLKLALQFAGLRETTEGWRGQLNLDF